MAALDIATSAASVELHAFEAVPATDAGSNSESLSATLVVGDVRSDGVAARPPTRRAACVALAARVAVAAGYLTM